MRTVLYPLAAVLLATPLASQEYRLERDETLGIQFRVHRKLSRTPAGSLSTVPRFLARFAPVDVVA